MKKGWTRRALADVCQIRPPKSEARARLAPEAWVSFAPMEDLGIDRKHLRATRTKPLSAVLGSYTYFSEGDVLLAKITPCFENGKVGIASELTSGVGFGSSEFIVLRPCSQLDKEYLYYFLSTPDFRARGAERMTGAVGQKRVSKEFIESCLIPVPPLPEQRRIVGILDEAFDGIAVAKANAEKNLQNARALFESHLNAVFSEIGAIHREKRLIDICDEITVGHVGSMAKKYMENGIPFLRSQNVRPFEISMENLVYIDEAFNKSLRKSQLRPGDVVVVRTGYPGTAAVIPTSLPVCNCSDLVIVRPRRDTDPHYLAVFFNSSLGKNLVAGRLVGAAQKHFNVTAAKQVTLAFPPISEQREVVAKIRKLGIETQCLQSIYQRKLAGLDELKKSLLDQAFSGEL